MTYEQLYEHCSTLRDKRILAAKLCCEEARFDAEARVEMMDMILDAIDKQIAKKPSKTFDHTWGIEKVANVCPCCDYYLGNHTFITVGVGKEKIIYCETCGQAIDWSDES